VPLVVVRMKAVVFPHVVDQSLSLCGLDDPVYIAGNYLTARVFGTGIL